MEIKIKENQFYFSDEEIKIKREITDVSLIESKDGFSIYGNKGERDVFSFSYLSGHGRFVLWIFGGKKRINVISEIKIGEITEILKESEKWRKN